MGKQPSSRRDGFGTEGIGDDDRDADVGTRGHSSQGGTAGTITGGTQSHTPDSRKPTTSPSSKERPRDEEPAADA